MVRFKVTIPQAQSATTTGHMIRAYVVTSLPEVTLRLYLLALHQMALRSSSNGTVVWSDFILRRGCLTQALNFVVGLQLEFIAKLYSCQGDVLRGPGCVCADL